MIVVLKFDAIQYYSWKDLIAEELHAKFENLKLKNGNTWSFVLEVS